MLSIGTISAARQPSIVSGQSSQSDLSNVLIPVERGKLQPAQQRILRLLMAREGELVTFRQLVGRGSINALHYHVHFIRRLLISDCWINSEPGKGFVFRRRVLCDNRRHAAV
jgi:hypothetical protein